MSNIKKTKKSKKSEDISKIKSNSILPLIGAPNNNKSQNIVNNKTKENDINESIEETKANNKEKKIINIQIKNIKNKSAIENTQEDDLEKDRSNYKLINSRNINNDSKLSPIKKINNKNKTEIINEVEKSEIKSNKITQSKYKIIFVFRNEDFYISVKGDTKIKNLKVTISKIINLDVHQICMIYEDKEIESSNDEKTINAFFNFKRLRSRPIIFIKKKFVMNNSDIDSSNFFLFKKTFNNKVKIKNFPSIGDTSISIEENITNIITNFFKNNCSCNTPQENNQYKIESANYNSEAKSENISYIIGFPTPDLAFDFNRYLNTLKLINPIYKDIKSNIITMKKYSSLNKITNKSRKNSPKGNIRYGVDYNLEENDISKMNSNILKLIRINYLQRKQLKKEKNNSNLYVNVSGPYLSSIDKDRLEEKENKKKWIVPQGFISCVGKYSGIQL